MNCLILVDLQNDFMPGGALPVPRGDEVVEVANRIAPAFDLVVASQDWHPSDHLSFASQHFGKKAGDVIQLHGIGQVLWPDHCIQESWGASFHSGLEEGWIDFVYQKGADRNFDSYSAFYDNKRKRATGLGKSLKKRCVSEIWILGLATDYCVKFTALDAVTEGWTTHVVREGCRGIDLAAGDVEAAWDEMEMAGVNIVSAEAFG